jgi:hypothetical protein
VMLILGEGGVDEEEEEGETGNLELQEPIG